jgi:hypothetical protein
VNVFIKNRYKADKKIITDPKPSQSSSTQSVQRLNTNRIEKRLIISKPPPWPRGKAVAPNIPPEKRINIETYFLMKRFRRKLIERLINSLRKKRRLCQGLSNKTSPLMTFRQRSRRLL